MARPLRGGLGVQVDGHNESIQTQHLSEDENEDHTHEEAGLLGCPPHSCITHNTNSKTCSQARQSYAEASPKVYKAPENNLISLYVLLKLETQTSKIKC